VYQQILSGRQLPNLQIIVAVVYFNRGSSAREFKRDVMISFQ
jgi:hypothetical protein